MKMLAFDIETTGLDPKDSIVTVVCTEDVWSGEKKAYEFARYAEDKESILQELIRDFETCDALAAFNGVRFDIPFLQGAFKLDSDMVLRWILKTSDILEQCRLRYQQTFKLDLLCMHNNMQGKSADGLAAIQMAKTKQFDELRDYCADDVSLLCKLYQKRHVLNPRDNFEMDLANFSHSNLYANCLMSVTKQTLLPVVEESTPEDLALDEAV